MEPVTRPIRCPRETFNTTIRNVKSNELKNRLRSIENNVFEAAQDYAVRAVVPDLHSIATMEIVGTVLKDELVKNYDNRLAKKASPGRDIYDELKSLPNGDICPYCNHRDVSTLDHFLPKSHFPILAVAPDNLIGVCSDCNKKKGDTIPAALTDTFLHPYFENISNEQWLFAEVIHSTPPAIRFFTQFPLGWSEELGQRVLYQFDRLELASLYAKQAAREMSDIRSGLQLHLENGGSIRVQRELEHQWNSRRANQINSWKTAMYEALKNSAWYYEGGFQN